MSFLNSLIHGNALSEILLEGHNPSALQKLETADVDALRQQLFTSEALRAFVSGRIVMSGRGVWALTDRALLVYDAALRTVQRLDMAQIESFEAECGRFGHTVRLQANGRRWSLYGVDRDFARGMHEGLTAGGVASRFDDRPARSHVWRDSAPEGWAQDCLEDARRRLALAA